MLRVILIPGLRVSCYVTRRREGIKVVSPGMILLEMTQIDFFVRSSTKKSQDANGFATAKRREVRRERERV